ncbi:MAG: hypothetical protein CVU65_14215 [Deltaproteobacteria bacterium HGW-Deltaproteobacteria-22]|jgi:thiol-disulfide isomerase/thioredoxin|nr:MAG: hypothetical protein CVU65_14215 [Deltaproteobacteria bacterium HGW-Deltaproteobacteria-22]
MLIKNILLFALLATAFVSCKSKNEMKDAKLPEESGAMKAGPVADGAEVSPLAAPDFTVPALDGGTCTLSAHKGKPVLLEFWSMGCPHCRKMIAELPKIAAALPELVIVSVHAGGKGAADQIKAQFPEKTFPVCLDDGSARKAYKDLPAPFKVGGIPHFILIDAQGQMRRAVVGYRPAAAMIAEIRASGILE